MVTSPSSSNSPASGRPIRLVVLFGGQSAEHDVSCTTAAHVLAAADKGRYEIQAIGIDRQGNFLATEDAATLLAKANDGGDTISPLVPEGSPTDLMAMVRSTPDAQQVVVLPLLHGPLGEDGTVQGLCELADVAYVGAGVLGSAVSMDKAMAKTVLDAQGLPQTKWLAFNEHQCTADLDGVLTQTVEQLGFPCFIKPANMGSSVGVSKASNESELRDAIAAALIYDEVLVIEESVDAREIELAVLGNHELEISVPGEIVPGAEFYDYNDKYHDGNAQLFIPAELGDGVAEELKALAGEAYRALRVEGMARADFLYEEGGRGPLINELNTIPGFTPISMYPKLWAASGLSYSNLIDRLVDLALERHSRRSSKRTTKR